MTARAAQFSLFAVALLIGVLLVGQLRSQARPVELGGMSAQDLSALIEQLQAGNVGLRDGVARLREQVRTYETASAQGQSAFDVTEQELRRITAFGGLAPVSGQGIRMQVVGSVDPIAVNDLINELRNAGAEAIAVDDVRITASSIAVLGTGAIEIDGVPIESQFRMTAIGSPEGLLSALQRPGGIMSQLEQSVAATFTFAESDSIRLPATARELVPEVARPVE